AGTLSLLFSEGSTQAFHIAEGRQNRTVNHSKMIAPPYKKIAVASTFSPRFEQVLAEAKRIRNSLGSELNLIFVGERDEGTISRFAGALAEMGLPAESLIHYHQGSPADAILEAVRENGVELLVAGALEKEVVLRSFLGNVARRLVREAPCSLILFTKPEREPKPLKRIVFFVPDFSDHARRALRLSLQFAEKEGCEHLYVIRVYTTFDAARATLRANLPDDTDQVAAPTLEEEEKALEDFIGARKTQIEVEGRCIRGNTGFAASDFVQSVKADLLVVPVEATNESDGLPAHIAWVTDVIPCNLWIIR
ncbi:MAG: universal stress protein, partial [Verrucomicrobiota bacterium]|nr:universal stress protein [Verrucomicrobiota bacterium]